MNNLELDAYTMLSVAPGKKAMENKIPLVALAMLETQERGITGHIYKRKQDWFRKKRKKISREKRVYLQSLTATIEWEKILNKSNDCFYKSPGKHRICKISMMKCQRNERMN